MPTTNQKTTKRQTTAFLLDLQHYLSLKDTRPDKQQQQQQQQQQQDEAALIQVNQERTAAILECHQQFRLLRQQQRQQRQQQQTCTRPNNVNSSSGDMQQQLQQQQSSSSSHEEIIQVVLQRRRDELCRQQRLVAAPAVLQHFGSRSLWYNLCPADRWKRETLLQIYNYSDSSSSTTATAVAATVPPELSERVWIETFVTKNDNDHSADYTSSSLSHSCVELWQQGDWILQDADILLARVQQQQANNQFEQQHTTKSLKFFLQPFLSNIPVLCQLITHIPQLMVHCCGDDNDNGGEKSVSLLPPEHYQNADILLAYCRAPGLTACVALPQFDRALFDNAGVMLQVLQAGVPVWSYLSPRLLNDKKFLLTAAAEAAAAAAAETEPCQSSSSSSSSSSSPSSSPRIKSSNEHFRGSFAYVSTRLQADMDIIRAYCKIDGTSLQWVSWNELLLVASDDNNDNHQCREIVYAACQQHPKAISHISSSCPARMELLQDAQFVQRLLQQWRDESNSSSSFSWQVWNDVPKDLLLQNTAVAGAALATYASHVVLIKAPPTTQTSSHQRHHRDKWHEQELLPSSCLHDPAVWLRAFEYCSHLQYDSSKRTLLLRVLQQQLLWSRIPTQLLQDCHTLVWPLLQQSSQKIKLSAQILGDMRQWFVQLQDDPQYWLCAIQHSAGIVHEIPDSILANHPDVVQAACRFDPAGMLTRPRNTEMLQEEIVVSTLLYHKPSLWRVLPNHVRLLYPDLLAVAMTKDFAATREKNNDGRSSSTTHPSGNIVPSLPPQVWVHPSVALAWCKYHRNLPPSLRPRDIRTYASYLTNVDFMLQVVEFNLHWFRDMSKPLCSNREFVQRAIAKDPRILCWASDAIRNDFDLQLAAFSKRADLPFRFSSLSYSSNSRDPEEGFALVATFVFEVRRRLQMHRTLERVFEHAAAMTDPPCSLHLLNQGHETVQMYKERVTEYLVGYQMSDSEVQQLQQASANLLLWGF